MNNHKSAIKKNIIDLLMFSLYADARTIYREYVQNALDAINRAVNEGVLNQIKDGVVNIAIDKNQKTITITDNGCGIGMNEAPTRLLDISASSKDGITAAGQFGIGRLVGGGYCHKLVFKTSAKGEDKATMVAFDIDAIWHMVKEDPEEYLATHVIDMCTTVEHTDEDENSHYFTVCLYDVNSENAAILLDKMEIVRYLNSIAPVEYKPEFSTVLIHKSTALQPEYKELHGNLPRVQLFVNNIRIQKQYGLTVIGSKEDKINNLEYFTIEDPRYGKLGWGWFALTKFTVQIDKSDTLSCIRLRKHNIQIGDFNLLSGKPLWREERGNSYFYGEFFITNNNLLPNAARDGLAPTSEKEALYSHLSDYFKTLSEIYVKANQAKKAIDKILEGAERILADRKVDRIARDLIENKGIAIFTKLLRNAQGNPIQRMLQLYQPEFEEAKAKAEIAKANFSSPTAHEVEIKQSVIETEGDKVGNATALPYENITVASDSGENNYVATDNGYSSSKGPSGIINADDKESENDRSGTTTESETNKLTPDDEYTNAQKTIEIKPSLSPLIRRPDIISSLEQILDENEIWLLRRIFKVLNTFCPDNERDQRLIYSLEKQIINELKNGL